MAILGDPDNTSSDPDGPSMMRRRVLTCALLAVTIGLRDAGAQATPSSDVEQLVKAAYLYKFGNYVEWPQGAFERPDSPIIVGVIGADALANDLAQMVAGRTLNGRQIQVRKVPPEDQIGALNVLFIGHSSKARIAEILAAAKGQPILVVTETEQALTLGSMINFVLVNGKLRFEIAPKAANSGNLNISARLLAAAYKVVPGAS